MLGNQWPAELVGARCDLVPIKPMSRCPDAEPIPVREITRLLRSSQVPLDALQRLLLSKQLFERRLDRVTFLLTLLMHLAATNDVLPGRPHVSGSGLSRTTGLFLPRGGRDLSHGTGWVEELPARRTDREGAAEGRSKRVSAPLHRCAWRLATQREQLAGSRLAQGGDHPLAGVVTSPKASSRTMPPTWGDLVHDLRHACGAEVPTHRDAARPSGCPVGGNIVPRPHGTWSSS